MDNIQKITAIAVPAVLLIAFMTACQPSLPDNEASAKKAVELIERIHRWCRETYPEIGYHDWNRECTQEWIDAGTPELPDLKYPLDW